MKLGEISGDGAPNKLNEKFYLSTS